MAVPAPVRQALEMNYEPFPPDIPKAAAPISS